MLEINQRLPDWKLEPIFDDEVPRVDDFRGKPLLILFFYLGCPGCKGRAIPYANRVVVEHGNEINVLGIQSNFEGPEYTDEQLQLAKKELFIRFPYFRDSGLASTFHEYQAAGTPHWVLCDNEGMVVDSIFGSDPNRALLRLDYHFEELFQP